MTWRDKPEIGSIDDVPHRKENGPGTRTRLLEMPAGVTASLVRPTPALDQSPARVAPSARRSERKPRVLIHARTRAKRGS
jgi:hypothetical protein